MTERDLGAVAAAGRARIGELVGGLDASGAVTPVPTCPEWTVQDVVAHLTGVCSDVLAGNIEGVATEPWTAAQVEARRGRGLAEVLEEWAEVGPQVEAMVQHFPGRVGSQFVLDVTSHEHDLRTALGRPGARDSEAVSVAVEFMVPVGLDAALSVRGLGPLDVRAEDRSWVVGGGGADAASVDAVLEERLLGADVVPPTEPPVGALTAPAFELVRATTGRRSRSQIAALDWSVDPEPYLDAFEFGPFTASAVDIDE